MSRRERRAPGAGRDHARRHYEVRIDVIRPEVEFSFYRITRSGRDTLPALDQFTQMFAAAAQLSPSNAASRAR
ncbi:hypothetical protein [Paraburkholderia strydomiana]|uniref:hypothetical protein n=1 Tax=Paraburkholderia strydomiana TaxID=1245417 RepID=UPI00285E6CAE|nr:hypothetical protein [Paraburkholderia strydomiana]MDR7006243.1 hypothetical protein [Paraburkholderia strydomiana]